MTVAGLRDSSAASSVAATATGVPQYPQNAKRSGISSPQVGQVRAGDASVTRYLMNPLSGLTRSTDQLPSDALTMLRRHGVFDAVALQRFVKTCSVPLAELL